MRVFILIFFLGCNGLIAHGEEAWTLEQCIKYGWENNLTIRIDENRSESVKRSYEEARLSLLPTLSGGSNFNYNMGRSVADDNSITFDPQVSHSYGVNANITLFSGFRKMHQIAAARYRFGAEECAVERSKNALAVALTSHYFGVLYLGECIAIEKEQLEISKLDLVHMQQLVNVGKREPSAIDEIKATVSYQQLNLLRKEQEYELALLDLEQMLELPNGSDFRIADLGIELAKPIEFTLSFDSVFELAKSTLPRIKQLELNVKSGAKYIARARSGLYPNLSANGGLATRFFSGNQNAYAQQINDNINAYVGLNLNIPILQGYSNRKNAARQKIFFDTEKTVLEQEKRTLAKDIHQSIKRLETSCKEYEAANDALVFIEKAFNTNREKLLLGLITTNDLYVYQTRLLSAKVEVLSARYNWVIQRGLINYYTGNGFF